MFTKSAQKYRKNMIVTIAANKNIIHVLALFTKPKGCYDIAQTILLSDIFLMLPFISTLFYTFVINS